MSRRDPIHYGPWEVTVTDGDTAMRYEVYAATEFEACEEVMAHSDYRASIEAEPEDAPVVTITARRIS